jgi:hypothetical protein
MAADVIGRCHCPVCASTRASLRLSAKGLAYVLCNSCNVQVFARSGQSDEKLRALLIEREGAAPVAPEATPSKPEPVSQAKAPAAVVPVKINTPVPEPKRQGWGMLG